MSISLVSGSGTQCARNLLARHTALPTGNLPEKYLVSQTKPALTRGVTRPYTEPCERPGSTQSGLSHLAKGDDQRRAKRRAERVRRSESERQVTKQHDFLFDHGV
jgi:hypothetical protein